MPDFINHTARVCESNFDWATTVQGSKGNAYTVAYGKLPPNAPYQYGYTCTCPQYAYRGVECKHIRQVEQSHARCGWGAEAFAGSFSEANCDGTCPNCGGPTRVVSVAV